MPPLETYRRKRRFEASPEPFGKEAPAAGNRFVVQKHAARRLHYDFRLEIDGVLKSWAVPKGPTLDPASKRLAVQTEDHPLDYADFEGIIPEGNYGAGTVMVWDRGTFQMLGESSADEQLVRGELKFTLTGQKLRGGFALVKLRRSEKGNEWLLIKHKDATADRKWNIDEHDGSVLTGRMLTEIAEGLPSAYATRSLSPTELEGARKAAMPADLKPMLATLVDKPFSHPAWLFELKWDGVRALAWVKNGKIELRSRSGRVISGQYPELKFLPEQVRARQAILDGEIVVLDEHGRGDFERLQARMNVSRPSAGILRQAPITYYLFDILYCDGYDLREVPLAQRRQLLRGVLEPCDPIRYSDHEAERGIELFELARAQGLEGIVGKHARSPYVSRRSPSWVKFKTRHEVDALVSGWTEPRGSREYFGALLLGLYEGKSLHFIGSVGSGFTQKTQKEIYQQLRKLETQRWPFDSVPDTKEKAFWVKPALVARVEFGGWTAERRLRQPVFLGLRPDADSQECQFETEQPVEEVPAVVTAAAVIGQVLRKTAEIERELYKGSVENATVELDGKRLRLTHLNKVYFPESGYTKRDLLAYYYRMADHLLPFLHERPLVLRRYPDGIQGESFFQKDAGEGVPEWMETLAVHSEERRQEIRYYVANDRAALLYLTNLGCIDHNPWASRRDDLEHPDYILFDLDPTEGTLFDTVVAVARRVDAKLRRLGLLPFVKTSGATGMHLLVPLERRYTYEQVRTFAEIVARLVAAEEPECVTQERAVEKRPRGKVYLDVFQNAPGRPIAAAYTVRAFPRAPVSTPLAPKELSGKLQPERFNLRTIWARLETQGDLWADFWRKRQTLEEATQALGSQLTKIRKA